MAISVTLADVKCIIPLDTNVDDTCWQAMLDDACLIVTELGIDTECGDERADFVAKYLAAHFMTIRDPRQIEEETLDSRQKFASTVDLGLESSHWGQMAKRFDCTNQLNDLDADAEGDKVKPKHIFGVSGR